MGAFALPAPSDCWLTIGPAEVCEKEGEGCWQPELTRHCPTDAGEVKTAVWTAPCCLDESESEVEVLKLLIARGLAASVVRENDRRTGFPPRVGKTPSQGGWNPDTGYVDRG